MSGKTRSGVWVLDADLAAAFDRIDHARLLAALGTFPARDMIAGWLKAGVIEDGAVRPDRGGHSARRGDQPVADERGAARAGGRPQGSGTETTGRHAGDTEPGSPVLVRYADDLVVVLPHPVSRPQQVKAGWPTWLAPRGLAFNEDKTKIVHLDRGVRLPGVQRPPLPQRQAADQAEQRRPSGDSGARLAAEVRALRGSNAAAVIAALNPIIRGWAAYYRRAVSSKVFGALDDYMWRLTYRWAKRTHPNKPKRWVVRPVLRQVQQVQERPVGVRDRAARRAARPYLPKFAWTPIVRHQLVAGTASPDDPALADYWAARRRRGQAPARQLQPAPAHQAGTGAARSAAIHCSRRPRPQSAAEWERGG